jgi:hypothetical protein
MSQYTVKWYLSIHEETPNEFVAQIGHRIEPGMKEIWDGDNPFMFYIEETGKAVIVEFWISGGDYCGKANLRMYVPREDNRIEFYRGELNGLFAFRLDNTERIHLAQQVVISHGDPLAHRHAPSGASFDHL